VGAFIYGPVHGFMIWNLLLAAIPAVLALALFTTSTRRGPVWWVGAGVWVLFLPNAPYPLTDVVHMVGAMRVSRSDQHAYLVLLTYAVLFTCGLASYALSLQLFRRYLHRTISSRFVAPTVSFVHALCVVAMYIGRFVRLNSWDAILAPQRVAASVLRVPGPFTVALLAAMFVVVGAGTFATVAVGDKVVAQARRVHPF
jgi:uncharacterized membrane protein